MKTIRMIAAFMAIVVMFTVAVGLAGCGRLDKPPDYEIKIFNESWEETTKYSYSYEYDGEPKLFNAIVYVHGEEVWRLDYKNQTGFGGLITVYVDTVSITKDQMPRERGEYKLDFFINIFYEINGKSLPGLSIKRYLDII